MPRPESDEAFLVRVSNDRGEITWGELNSLGANDLSRLAALSIKVSQWPRVVRIPALWVERKSYASEGRTLARKLKSSLDGFHTPPQVGTIDAEWFFRVCIGLACDSRLNFDNSTPSASSGPEARAALGLIFKALQGEARGTPGKRRLAELGPSRSARRVPASTTRPFSYVELYDAMLDVLTGERRIHPARRKRCWSIIERAGFSILVKRELKKVPAGSNSEALARRKAAALLGLVFGLSPANLRTRRHREKLRSQNRIRGKA